MASSLYNGSVLGVRQFRADKAGESVIFERHASGTILRQASDGSLVGSLVESEVVGRSAILSVQKANLWSHDLGPLQQ